MYSIFPWAPKLAWARAVLLALPLFVLLFCPLSGLAAGKQKYKKNTVIDFEGALVEGKSRKPYSAYLYKQKEQAAKDLSEWDLDLSKGIAFSKERIAE